MDEEKMPSLVQHKYDDAEDMDEEKMLALVQRKDDEDDNDLTMSLTRRMMPMTCQIQDQARGR
eukprot:13026979-Ditylum_brightwellii.AAC.1